MRLLLIDVHIDYNIYIIKTYIIKRSYMQADRENYWYRKRLIT